MIPVPWPGRRLGFAIRRSLLLVCLAAAVEAHQLRAAITTVLFNPRTGDIEVMHRFFSHDAEHALALITDGPADLDDADDRAGFARYAHQGFTLTGKGAELEPLELVGSELEGDFLWVYQRTPIAAGLHGLEMRFDTLRDVWPDQVNTVNVERGGEVRTLTFAGDDTVGRVSFTDDG